MDTRRLIMNDKQKRIFLYLSKNNQLQKIELASINDYKKAIGNAIKKVDKLEGDYKKFIDTKNKEYATVQEDFADKAKKEREKLISTSFNKVRDIEENTFDMFDKIYNDAKELGVLDTVQKELSSISKKLDDKVREFDDIKREYIFNRF
jgi:rubrerythrin